MNDFAFLLGMTAGHALDPLVIPLGLIIGVALPRWWQRLLGVLVAAVAFALLVGAIDELGTDPFGGLSAIGRACALLLWAIVGWVIRTVASRLQRRQSSFGSD